MQLLLERVHDEAGMGRAVDAPAHDAPGVGVDDERHVEKPVRVAT